MTTANSGLRTPIQRAIAQKNLEKEIEMAKLLGYRSLPAKPFDFKSLDELERDRVEVDAKLAKLGYPKVRLK